MYLNAIQSFVPAQVVKTIAAFLDFCYIARRNVITDDSLSQLKVALQKFHEARQVFSGTVRAHGPSAFSLPRQHAMVHYADHIENFGSPNGLCSSITESKHITAVKRPWRRSNKHMALPQILKVNERLDKLAAARADFAARGMLVDSCLAHAIKDNLGNESPMDEDPGTDSDETESESSDDEILIPELNHTGTQYIHTFDNAPNNAPSDALDNILDDAPDDDPDNDPNDNDPDNDPDNDNNNNNNNNDPSDAPNNTHEELVDDTTERVLSLDDNSSQQPLAAPPDYMEDDDCGPVESGPLMNEVRLVARKG